VAHHRCLAPAGIVSCHVERLTTPYPSSVTANGGGLPACIGSCGILPSSRCIRSTYVQPWLLEDQPPVTLYLLLLKERRKESKKRPREGRQRQRTLTILPIFWILPSHRRQTVKPSNRQSVNLLIRQSANPFIEYPGSRTLLHTTTPLTK
jgi:hypothetical protein